MRRKHLPSAPPVAEGLRTDAGAIFIDSLIAAAMVAMALGAMLQVVAESGGRERQGEQRRAALLVAQSELDAAGSDIPLRSGRSVGIIGDLTWRMDISPFDQAGAANTSGALWVVAISVRPRAGGTDLVTLKTLRLGAPA